MKTTAHSLACLVVVLAASHSVLAADPPLALHNGRLSVAFDPAQHGAITSLVADGCQFIAKQRTPRLFQLDLSPAGDLMAKRIIVSSRDMARYKATRRTEGRQTIARLEFAGPAERPIEVVCTFTATEGDPLMRARIEVQCPPSLVLESVRFPMMTLRAPLGQGESDALVLGSTKGGVYRQPWAYKPGQGVQFTQPGNLVAAMACYGDDDIGLFSGLFDTRGYRKSVAATRTNEGLDLAWVHPCLIAGRFATGYDAVLTTYSRREQGRRVDWRDGADIYKAWAVHRPWCAKTLAQRDDLPAWYKRGPAMVRFGREWLAKPERIERWLKDYWQGQFPRMPLIVAYWGWEKVDTWITPEYFPCFPSDEEFRRLVKLGRTMDAHAFCWPSGYHYTITYDKGPDGHFVWDDRARFDAEARSHAICGRDGKVIIGDRFWLRGGQCATVCPGDAWTIDWFNRICAQIASRGVEMIQVDQVVGGGFPLCYSATHGHAPGAGLWTSDAIHKQLDTMLAECRKIEPEAIIGVEEPNEWFIQQVGIQDYRDLESLKGLATEPASVFGYLYHEYLPMFQSNPPGHLRLAEAYCLVNGQMPHFVPSARMGGPLPVNGGFEEMHSRFPEAWDKVRGYKGVVYSGEATSDAEQHHAGHASLRLKNTEPGQVVQVSQNVPMGGDFQPGRTYRLSVWMKTAGLKDANAVSFATFASGLESTGGWRIGVPRTDSDWTRGSADFTVPAASAMLRIMLQLTGPGTLWLDDLHLEEVRADGSFAEVQQPKWPIDHEFMRQWVDLFHGAGRPYLFFGKMVHPPELNVGTVDALNRKFPAVLHNAYQAPDQSVAVVLVNVTDVPQTVDLAWPGTKDRQSLVLQPWQVRLVPKAGR